MVHERSLEGWRFSLVVKCGLTQARCWLVSKKGLTYRVQLLQGAERVLSESSKLAEGLHLLGAVC
jgi:hypothetical protein